MTHHADGRKPRPHMTTGRLALWLGFWLFMAIMAMGTVLSLAGKGGS